MEHSSYPEETLRPFWRGLLHPHIVKESFYHHQEDTGFGGNGVENLAPPPKKSGLGENLISYVFGRVFIKIYI